MAYPYILIPKVGCSSLNFASLSPTFCGKQKKQAASGSKRQQAAASGSKQQQAAASSSKQ